MNSKGGRSKGSKGIDWEETITKYLDNKTYVDGLDSALKKATFLRLKCRVHWYKLLEKINNKKINKEKQSEKSICSVCKETEKIIREKEDIMLLPDCQHSICMICLAYLIRRCPKVCLSFF